MRSALGPPAALLGALLAPFATGGSLRAQPTTAVVATSAAPSALDRLEVHGFLDLYYAWNGDRPSTKSNFFPGYGNSAKRANELGVNLAGLDLEIAPEPLGFHLAIAAGTEMEMLKSGEPAGEATSRDAFRHLYRASISYATDLGRGLLVEGGLYPSHIGFESPLPKDNWSYTQAWAGNLTPSYQVGIKLLYPLTEALTAELHVCNGWQVTADNNDRPSYGTRLAWTSARGSLALGTWYGPELPNDDDDVRTLIDLVATATPTARLQLAVEGISGRQQRPGQAAGADRWTLVAAWARFALGERTALALRLERVEDVGGAISGSAQTLEEATITFEHRPVPTLALKLEARRDRSDAEVFDDHGRPSGSQALVVAAAIYTF